MPKPGRLLGLPAGDDFAFRINGFADDHGAVIGQLVDAEERTATLAEIFHGEAEHRVEQQQRNNDQIGMAVGARVVGVGVEWVVVQRQGWRTAYCRRR